MSKISYIAHEVNRIAQKHGTRDPYELCDALNFTIRYKDLGYSLKAYFIQVARINNVVINQNVSEVVRKILIAHEMGHAVLHKEIAAMKGFQEFELFDAGNMTEYEANLFAAELLVEDEPLLEMLNDSDKSFFGVARELYVPAELLDFKFRVLKHKGYHIEPPLMANADFLKENTPNIYEMD